MQVLRARVERAEPRSRVSWKEGAQRQAVVAAAARVSWDEGAQRHRPRHAGRVFQHVESLATVVARHFLQGRPGTVTTPTKKITKYKNLQPYVTNIKIEPEAEIMAKELSISGYVRASAETEAGKGKVWLHRCVSSALCTEYKKRQKTWRSLSCPEKNYQFLAMCELQLRLKLERGEYGCIDVYISSALSTDYKKRPKTWRSFISSSKELSVSGYVWSSAETEAGKGKVWLHRCVSSALCAKYKRKSEA